MNKQLKWVLRVINIGCFFALILSCIVPIERKETLTSNIDVSSYGNLHSIPRIGSVTDEKQMKLKFNLYDEKLYGVNLYFGVDGDDENGKVTCAIEYNNETLAKQTFSLKELASLTEGSSLNSVEILLDDFEKRDGEYTVVIKGTGISPETRVSLLGNINTGSYFRYEESGSYGEYYSILYAIETLNPKHPYVWACALIFALCLLSSYVFYISYEESKVETVK